MCIICPDIMKRREVFTIGHSDRSPGKFAELLAMHAVSAVADVRSAPYSGRFPQFNREKLKKTLSEEGLEYVFLGKELGARRGENYCYENGRTDKNSPAISGEF